MPGNWWDEYTDPAPVEPSPQPETGDNWWEAYTTPEQPPAQSNWWDEYTSFTPGPAKPLPGSPEMYAAVQSAAQPMGPGGVPYAEYERAKRKKQYEAVAAGQDPFTRNVIGGLTEDFAGQGAALLARGLDYLPWTGDLWSETADEVTREQMAQQQAASKYSGDLGQAVRGAVPSLATMLASAGLGLGTAGVIGFQGLSAAEQGYIQAKDRGLSDWEAKKYAVTEGLIEGVTTAIFSKIGLAGAEGLLRKPVAEGIKATAKKLGRDLLAEEVEEITIGALHAFNQEMAGVDPNAADWSRLGEMAYQTTLQVGVMMGAAGGAHAAATALLPTEAQPAGRPSAPPLATFEGPPPGIMDLPMTGVTQEDIDYQAMLNRPNGIQEIAPPEALRTPTPLEYPEVGAAIRERGGPILKAQAPQEILPAREALSPLERADVPVELIPPQFDLGARERPIPPQREPAIDRGDVQRVILPWERKPGEVSKEVRPVSEKLPWEELPPETLPEPIPEIAPEAPAPARMEEPLPLEPMRPRGEVPQIAPTPPARVEVPPELELTPPFPERRPAEVPQIAPEPAGRTREALRAREEIQRRGIRPPFEPPAEILFQEGERRTDVAERKRISEMSPEEMRVALETDELMGIKNRRAWMDKERERKPVIVSGDGDSLKVLNDANEKLGWQKDPRRGDDYLRAVGEAYRAEGIDAYRVGGDEFMLEFDTEAEAQDAIARVERRLAESSLQWTMPDGRVFEYKGLGVTHGIGPTEEAADVRLGELKAERERTGVRAARGEIPRGLAELTSTGRKAVREPRPEAGPEPAPRYKPATLQPPVGLERVRPEARPEYLQHVKADLPPKPEVRSYSVEEIQRVMPNVTEDMAKTLDILLRKTGISLEEAVELARGGKPEAGALEQAEGIISGKENVPKTSRLKKALTFLKGYAREHPVIPKGTRIDTEAGRKAAVSAIIDHTMKELEAWKTVSKDYRGFYGEDIVQRTNPRIQEYARKNYGRELTDSEVSLVHLFSAFGSGQSEPTVDTMLGLKVMDEYIRTGKATGFSDKPKPIYRAPSRGVSPQRVYVDAKTGKDTFEAQGNKPKFDNTRKAQISKTYNTSGLERFNQVLGHFDGDLDQTIRWLGEKHSWPDIVSVIGEDAAKRLSPHENLDKKGETFGAFTLGNNPKLGSYILNRWQKLGTITKDMWVARTMARYFREPITGEPWLTTREGTNKRKILDEAWGEVAKRLGVEPANVQEMMWDAEKRLYGELGHESGGAYTSEAIPTPVSVTAEVIPSKAVPLGAALEKMPFEVRRAFTREVMKLFHDESGRNILAEKAGISEGVEAEGTGGFLGVINPNVLTTGGAPRKGGQADYSAFDRYAKAWQYIFRQEGVPWFRPDVGLDPAKLDAERAARGLGPRPDISMGFFLDWDHNLTPAEEQAFFKALRLELGEKAGYTRMDGSRIAITNFRNSETGQSLEGWSDQDFEAAIDRVAQAAGAKEAIQYGAESRYHYHDFGADPQGQALEAEIKGGRSGWEAYIRGRRSAFDALAKQYLDRQGSTVTPDVAADLEAEVGEEPQVGPATAAEAPPDILMQEGRARASDEEYLAAVERGDMKAAQRMVDKAIRKAGAWAGGVSPVVYHGSPHEAFNQFQIPSRGFNSTVFGKYEVSRNAAFFTPDKAIASGYQTQGDQKGGGVRAFRVLGEMLDWRHGMTNAQFNTLVDEGVNPKWLLRTGASWELFDAEWDPDATLIKAIKKMGYDGVIIADTDGTNDFDSYVALTPSQIKLADPVVHDDAGNVIPLSERFQSENPDIRYQAESAVAEPKGSVEFQKHGKALIRGYRAADVSTAAHEFAHVIRNLLLNRDVAPEKRAGVTDEDIAIAEQFSGAKDGVWDRAAEEKFARGFERYLRDGKAPTPELEGVFAKFAKWLGEIYQELKNSAIDIEIPEAMRGVYDRLLTRGERLGLTPPFSPQPMTAESFRPPQPKGILQNVAGYLKRNLTSIGDLPQEAFNRNLEREGGIAAAMAETTTIMKQFREAARKTYGRDATAAENKKISSVLKGEAELSSLPEGIRAPVAEMRLNVTALSRKLLDSGAVQGDLAATVEANMDTYLHRSYKVFHDPKWAQQVPQEVINQAVNHVRKAHPEATDAEIQGIMRRLLDPQADSPLSFFMGGKMGAKDLSILKQRKAVPEWLRQLWGEEQDPINNYVRSVVNMAHLIENHRFLKDVRKQGLNKFLFENPTGDHYVKLAGDESKTYSPLNGLYTTKEIADALNKVGQADKINSTMLKAYLKVVAFAKYGKTVGNFPTGHIRNFLGNAAFAIANGHWNPGNAQHALKSTYGYLRSGGDALVQKLQRLGILDSDVTAGELRDIARDASSQTDLADALLLPGTKAGKLVKGAIQFGAKTYQAVDNVWKINGFLSEVENYKKAYPSWSQERVEKKAAEIIRNAYPTYSMIPEQIKKLRRVPVLGTFVSFPAEVLRTTAKTLQLVKAELGQKETRAIGAKRLAGVMTAATVPYVLAQAARAMAGVDDEEEESLRRFVAPWNKNSTILWTEKGKDGKHSFVDFSFMDPHKYFRAPLMAFMRGDDIEESIREATKEASAPFTEENIVLAALLDVARNKAEPSGRKIYNEQDAWLNQATNVADHLRKAVEPGVVSSSERLIKGLRGKTSDYGKVYDPETEALSMFAGTRIQTIDVEQSLFFKGTAYKKGIAEAASLVRKPLGRKGEVTDEEIAKAYGVTETSRQALFEEILEDIQAAGKIGLTPEQIKTALKNAGLGREEIRRLFAGTYSAYKPSEKPLQRRLQAALKPPFGGTDEDQLQDQPVGVATTGSRMPWE